MINLSENEDLQISVPQDGRLAANDICAEKLSQIVSWLDKYCDLAMIIRHWHKHMQEITVMALKNMVNREKTKGQTEAEISEAIIKFEKEYMGRGPDETRTYIIGDMVIVRLRGVLTPAEKQLARSDDSLNKGRALIKQVRIELLEKARPLLENIIQNILATKVTSMHTDISTVTGERVIIFTLESAPQIETQAGD